MYTNPCREAQAAIVVAEEKGYRFDWSLPHDDECVFFIKNPDAAFMLRPWRKSDDRFGFQFANLLDMDGITLVFRAGAREPRFYATRGEIAWRRAKADAAWFLSDRVAARESGRCLVSLRMPRTRRRWRPTFAGASLMTCFSPYNSAAHAILDAGYSPIPISPADKFPARFVGGQWYPMKDWSRFCSEFPSEFSVAQWSKWPEANVGVALGRGVIAFDIDLDDLIEPIRAALPPCIVAKRGRKGETLFFRGDTTAIKSGSFRRPMPTEANPKATEGLMDLIADGKQTVVPPSIHPITSEPYVWTTERTLLDTPPADLTEVTAEHMAAVIEVLRAHGWQTPEERRPIGSGSAGIVMDTVSTTADWFRRLNDDALANLSAWVPRLGLTRLVSYSDGYRSVAEWASDGRTPIGKRRLLLSIDPHGIVDYADGEKGYTAINLVMAAHGIADDELEKAAVWLGESLGYDFSPRIVLNRNRAKLSPLQQAQRAARAVQNADEDGAAPVVAPESVAAALAHPVEVAAASNVVSFDAAHSIDADEGERPTQVLTREEQLQALVEGVPGLIGDLVDWMRSTARTPNDILAFAASVAFVGALAGRNYETPTDARTNFYTLGLAPSGFGKEHARKVIGHIVDRGNIGRFLGPEQIMSGSALRKRITIQPSILYMIDEFGGFMSDVNNKKNPYQFQIRTDLLKLYGSAAGTFRGADYATEQATPVRCPNVCLYGTSTPADFWNSCRALSVSDGLLGRFMIFSVGGALPPTTRPVNRASDPPQSLIKACQRLTISKVGGNLNNVLADGTTACRAHVAKWCNDEAEDLFDEMSEEFRRRAFERGEAEGSLWGRTAENALKLALTIGVGIDPDEPVIRGEILQMARDIAELCTLMTLDQITGRLADNDRQREHVDVKRWIVEAGEVGISRTAISKRVNGRFDKRRLSDIIDSLKDESREIVASEHRPVGGGRPGIRYYSTAIVAAMADAG